MENEQDNTTTEPDGRKRKILCGTEKGKHKAKNHRTAGTNFITFKHIKVNNITDNPTQCTYIYKHFT